MSRVLITCPETGKNIYTGLNMEWNQLDSIEIGKHELDCPECGKRHYWTKLDAILQADGAG